MPRHQDLLRSIGFGLLVLMLLVLLLLAGWQLIAPVIAFDVGSPTLLPRPRSESSQSQPGTPSPTSLPPPSARLAATVLRVGDGDSLQVQIGAQKRAIRLACIDAPELDQAPWGSASRTYLQEHVRPGSAVQLLPKATDRYGRLVAEVITEPSRQAVGSIKTEANINLLLVQQGQAFVYPNHRHQCDAAAFSAAESRARARQEGVWQQSGGIQRPWKHRQLNRPSPQHRPRPSWYPSPASSSQSAAAR
jgi:endonuclease YncB( thermonuclease family)